MGAVTLKAKAERNQTPPRLWFSTNPGNSVSKAKADKFGRRLWKKPGIQTGPSQWKFGLVPIHCGLFIDKVLLAFENSLQETALQHLVHFVL